MWTVPLFWTSSNNAVFVHQNSSPLQIIIILQIPKTKHNAKNTWQYFILFNILFKIKYITEYLGIVTLENDNYRIKKIVSVITVLRFYQVIDSTLIFLSFLHRGVAERKTEADNWKIDPICPFPSISSFPTAKRATSQHIKPG